MCQCSNVATVAQNLKMAPAKRTASNVAYSVGSKGSNAFELFRTTSEVKRRRSFKETLRRTKLKMVNLLIFIFYVLLDVHGKCQ